MVRQSNWAARRGPARASWSLTNVVLDQLSHGGGDRIDVARIEFQGGGGGEAVERLDGGTGGGNAGGERFQQGQAKAFKKAGIQEGRGTAVEVVEIFARDPAGELHAGIQLQAFAQRMELGREKAMNAA